MSFSERLRKLLRIKKTQILQLALPEDAIPFMQKKIMIQNAEVNAENIKLKEKIRSLQEQDTIEEEEQEIKQKVIDAKENKKTMRERKVLIKKYIVNALPTFYLKSNKPFGKLWGELHEEHSDGSYSIFPVLEFKDAYGRKIKRKFDASVDSFENMFKENIGIVSSILGGKADTLFDIYNGKPEYIEPLEVDDDAPQNKQQDEPMDDIERNRYERKITELRGQMEEKNRRIRDLSLMKSDYEGQIAELEISLQSATRLAQNHGVSYATFVDKTTDHFRVLNELLPNFQSAMQGKILNERLNREYRTFIEDMMKEVGKTGKLMGMMSKEQKTIRDVNRVLDILNEKITTTATTAEQPPFIPPPQQQISQGMP